MWSTTMHDNQQHWIFGAVRNMVTAGNMGLSSRGVLEEMIKLLDPRPNDVTFQLCKTWLVSLMLRWKIEAESLWFGT